MANPQKENGYVAIATEILERLVNTPLLGSEFQIALFVIRKTYGYNKKEDVISLTQFQKNTGLSRPTVVKTIKNLMARKMVVKVYLPDARIAFSFNKNYDEWVVNTSKLVKGTWVTSKHVLTDNRQKDNTKDISSAVVNTAPWVLEEKLQKMESEPNSYLDIIATFIREKPVRVENGKQLSVIITRYCRVAKKLSGAYTNKQLLDAFNRLENDNKERKRKGLEGIDYTLETVYKVLTK